MFSFFKKPEKQNELREHLGNFQDEFSFKQKKAIMYSLLLIANADQEFHVKEIEFFEQMAMLLGYKLPKSYDAMMDDFMTLKREDVFRELNSLKESQKDWYIVTAFSLVHADGKALDAEFQYVEAFCSRMGISVERFESTIQKSQLLVKNL